MKKRFTGILLGTLLGDANLEKKRIRINHSDKQKEYLFWKAKILEELTSVLVKPFQGKVNGKEYPMWRLYTKNHPYYERVGKQIIRNGHKEINSYLMKRLTPEGVAVWFLDDGYIDRNSAHLFTHSFSEAENYLAKEWLLKKFGIKANVYKRRQYYYLRINVESTEKIVNWVKALNIPSMMYKVSSYEKPSIKRGDEMV